MKSRTKFLILLFTFLVLFVGASLFMYFKYIHNKPKVKIIAPRTEVDPIKFDSALKANSRIQK